MGTVMDTRISDFHFFLNTVGQRFSCISLFNSEFKCLHISTPHSNNSVGLMQSLKILKNFFAWDGSQVVVHNDPHLGCSRSDRIQFLFSADSFHFCIEESFPLPWDFDKKIIKIPPIPLVENNRVNTQLLETLTNHTDCPVGLNEFFLSILQKIEKFQTDFKNTLKITKDFGNKEVHKNYLAASANCSLSAIQSRSYCLSQVELEFEGHSFLKLKVTTSEQGIRIDFQGTSNNSQIQLTDLATDSICFHFFADYFQFRDMMNEATYSNFQIAKPTHSFANSKLFTNKIYSDLCGPDLVNQALLETVSERLTLKPYLLMRPYYQIKDPNSKCRILEFSFPNSKPIGSLGIAFMYEPLLCTRPMPGGFYIPDLREFKNFGLEVQNSQQLFPLKSKEINNFQSIVQIVCIKSIDIVVVQPIFPLKIKSNKTTGTILKPGLTINCQPLHVLSAIQSITINDQLEFKSGTIDFSP